MSKGLTEKVDFAVSCEGAVQPNPSKFLIFTILNFFIFLVIF